MVAPRGESEALEDREHLAGGDAVAVGRKLVDVGAAVVRGNRIDPGGGVLFEIRSAEEAAVGAHEGGDVFRDFAAVVGGAAVFADHGEPAGEREVLENLALRGWVAAGGKRVEEGAGKLVELGVADADGPAGGDVVGDGKIRLGAA